MDDDEEGSKKGCGGGGGERNEEAGFKVEKLVRVFKKAGPLD